MRWIVALMLMTSAAHAQNMGAPRGDYDRYISDRAAWEAKRAAEAQAPKYLCSPYGLPYGCVMPSSPVKR